MVVADDAGNTFEQPQQDQKDEEPMSDNNDHSEKEVTNGGIADNLDPRITSILVSIANLNEAVLNQSNKEKELQQQITDLKHEVEEKLLLDGVYEEFKKTVNKRLLKFEKQVKEDIDQCHVVVANTVDQAKKDLSVKTTSNTSNSALNLQSQVKNLVAQSEMAEWFQSKFDAHLQTNESKIVIKNWISAELNSYQVTTF